MVKNKAKKLTGQDYFDGSNKYTNGSRGYPSAFFVTHLKNLLVFKKLFMMTWI